MVEIKTVSKEKIEALRHNIKVLQSLSKDMLIGIIIGINDANERRIK